MRVNNLDAESLHGRPLPIPEAGSKEERGTVLVLGGSAELPGAALLAGVAALRAGAGRLRIATVESAATAIGVAVPEARVIALGGTAEGEIDPSRLSERLPTLTQRCDAILVGPGLNSGDATEQLVRSLLPGEAPASFVLDAGAVCGLGTHSDTVRSCGGRALITPHAGEMAQLLDMEREAVEADPLAAAMRAAERLACTVILKGAETWVVSAAGERWHYRGGGVGLATSGSGDALAGVLAGLLARGTDVLTAALWGVFLHGEAGRRLADRIGPVGFLAREIADAVPTILQETAAAGADVSRNAD
ncbi:NAD(P)H-hydrate dehydratase [Methylobacterium sp. CM6257]